MSFIPPVPAPLDQELARSQRGELEAKAARYAQQHPDDPDRGTSPGRIGRALRRVRAALARGR